MKFCRICKIELTDTNWGKANKKLNNNLCKNCQLERSKKWYKENKERILENNKKRYSENPEHIKDINNKWREKNSEYNKKYYEKHREGILEWRKQYYNENFEYELEYTKKYYENNKERILDYNAQWYDKNKERVLENGKLYKQSPQGKIAMAKAEAKRNRELGYISLNKIFDNANGHHLDKNYVIFIPEDIHTNIRHRQNDEKLMKKINMIAWDMMESGVY